jgi:DNA-directed RNA polymerase II subunit RPB11
MSYHRGILTATAAIAKDRAGRRGSAPAPRHERCQLPDDVPDVSVGVNYYPGYPFVFCASPTNTVTSETMSARSQTNQDTAHRYEAILLGPGENKIDVEVDTRKYFGGNEVI